MWPRKTCRAPTHRSKVLSTVRPRVLLAKGESVEDLLVAWHDYSLLRVIADEGGWACEDELVLNGFFGNMKPTAPAKQVMHDGRPQDLLRLM